MKIITRIDGEIEGKGMKENNILMKLEFSQGQVSCLEDLRLPKKIDL